MSDMHTYYDLYAFYFLHSHPYNYNNLHLEVTQ